MLEQDAQVVTFEEAVRLGLQQNTNLKRAQNDVRLQDALATQERMDFLPNLQFSSGGTRSFGRSFSQQEGEILSETSDFLDFEASTNIDLFNGFERFASLERAGLEQEASVLRLERTRQDVVFQVIDRFIVLLQNQQLAQVRAQELDVQEELLQQVESLTEVGRRPVSDLYQQQAARAEAEAALAEAERQVEQGKTQLIQVLQLDPRGTYTFGAPSLADTTALTPATYDLDQLIATATKQRTDLEALETSIDAAQEGVRAARSGYWPSLSLSFGYGSDWSSTALLPVTGTGRDPRTVTITPEGDEAPVTFPVPGTGSDPTFQRPDFFNQLNTRRGGTIRLSLGLPIFDRLQTRTSVEEAQVQLLDARYAFQDQQQQVALQVRQAVLDYRSAQTQRSATEERLRAARQARDAASRRYELGAATFVELAQANAEYVSARNALVRARYDVLLARKLVNYYTGDLDIRAPLSP